MDGDRGKSHAAGGEYHARCGDSGWKNRTRACADLAVGYDLKLKDKEGGRKKWLKTLRQWWRPQRFAALEMPGGRPQRSDPRSGALTA